jgi:hypothetical protein
MECGDLSPLFGEGFSLHHLAVDPHENRVALTVEPARAIEATERRV